MRGSETATPDVRPSCRARGASRSARGRRAGRARAGGSSPRRRGRARRRRCSRSSRERELVRREREADVRVRELRPQARQAASGRSRRGRTRSAGAARRACHAGVVRDGRVDVARDEAEVRGRELPFPRIAVGVASRLELLEVGELPDVDLGREVAPDRLLERLGRPRGSRRAAPSGPRTDPAPAATAAPGARRRGPGSTTASVTCRGAARIDFATRFETIRRKPPFDSAWRPRASSLLLAACGGDDDGSSAGTTEPAEMRRSRSALVTDVGQLNDRGFNQLAYEGLKRAEKELGVKIRVARVAVGVRLRPELHDARPATAST